MQYLQVYQSIWKLQINARTYLGSADLNQNKHLWYFFFGRGISIFWGWIFKIITENVLEHFIHARISFLSFVSHGSIEITYTMTRMSHCHPSVASWFEHETSTKKKSSYSSRNKNSKMLIYYIIYQNIRNSTLLCVRIN